MSGWPPACPACHGRRQHEDGCLLSGLSIALAAHCRDLLVALGESTTLVCPRCRSAVTHLAGCALAAMTIVQAWATGTTTTEWDDDGPPPPEGRRAAAASSGD